MSDTKIGNRLHIYWDKLTDTDIILLQEACEHELEQRSQGSVNNNIDGQE